MEKEMLPGKIWAKETLLEYGIPNHFQLLQKKNPVSYYLKFQWNNMNSKQLSAKELLVFINNLIETGQYNDSVHKIKLMTAQEVIEKILKSEF